VESWEEARLDTIRMTTAAPLERWSVAAKAAQASLEFDVEALTAPHELANQELGEATGIEQYEQLCRFSGTVDVGGRTYPVRCLGRRVHWWGEFAWNAIARWRNLYAVSLDGQAISVAGALPNGSEGHEQELRTAYALDLQEAPPFEDIRVSTVFDDEGGPRALAAGRRISAPPWRRVDLRQPHGAERPRARRVVLQVVDRRRACIRLLRAGEVSMSS